MHLVQITLHSNSKLCQASKHRKNPGIARKVPVPQMTLTATARGLHISKGISAHMPAIFTAATVELNEASSLYDVCTADTQYMCGSGLACR